MHLQAEIPQGHLQGSAGSGESCGDSDEKESSLDLLSIGLVNDMYAESRNDGYKYRELADQEDFDTF